MKNIKTSLKLVAVLLAIGCLTGCQTKQADQKKVDKTANISTKTAHEKLNYDDQENWELISGKMQSPIDIKTNKLATMTPDAGTLTLAYDQNIKKVENNGHSVQVTADGQSVINGRNFNLTQFHFHAKSEHTIDGNYYPMEVHFVNQSQDGRLAVIAVFFTEGAENSGFKEVLADVDTNKTNTISDINQMIPVNKSYYHYLGSLTTPPLTENVEWYIMKEPVQVSAEQIASFKKLYASNNRKIQPINDRKVLEHVE